MPITAARPVREWARGDRVVSDDRARLDVDAVHAFIAGTYWASVLEHPDLQDLRRLSLMTRDAHELYRRFGFKPLHDPARYLEIHRPNVHAPAA